MKREPEGSGAEPSTLWARIACLWAAAFAGLHFYWAVGGDVGLSISAGPLATQRPLWFVIAGLWGGGVLCLLGALLAWLLARSGLRGATALPARWLGWGVSALLLVRGIGIEVLLLTNTTHLDTSVGGGGGPGLSPSGTPGSSPEGWPSASQPFGPAGAVWASSPVTDAASGPIVYLLDSYSKAAEVAEYAALLPRERGLVCYDPQGESLRR